MNTDSVDYEGGIHAAWLGEKLGKAFFEQLAEATDDAALRAKWEVLAQLEDAVGNCLEPLVQADETSAASNSKLGSNAAASFAELPYAVALQQIKEVVDPAIDRYKRLLEQAPDSDREVVQILVDHEVAIQVFVEREMAGDSATSLDATRAVIGRVGAVGD